MSMISRGHSRIHRWRPWLAAVATGLVVGGVVEWIWADTDQRLTRCADELCRGVTGGTRWLAAPVWAGVLAWLLIRTIGGWPWFAALGPAVLGTVLGFAGVLVWEGLSSGTPRPPLVALLLGAVMCYAAATAPFTARRRGSRRT